MLDKYEIKNLIDLNSIGENSVEINEPTYLRKILKGKVRIDGWGYGILDTIIVPAHLQDEVEAELSTNEFYNAQSSSIWGATIYYSEEVPTDKIVMFCLNAQKEEHLAYCDYFAQLKSGELIASTNIAVISL